MHSGHSELHLKELINHIFFPGQRRVIRLVYYNIKRCAFAPQQ